MTKDDRLPFAGDAHWGKGGRYVLVDGKRVPAESVAPAAPPESPVVAPSAPASQPRKPTRRKRGQ